MAVDSRTAGVLEETVTADSAVKVVDLEKVQKNIFDYYISADNGGFGGNTNDFGDNCSGGFGGSNLLFFNNHVLDNGGNTQTCGDIIFFFNTQFLDGFGNTNGFGGNTGGFGGNRGGGFGGSK